MSLRGGTYIVTGGAGAIGSAVAAAIAARGGTIVVVCDIASDRAQVIADRIGGTAIQLDIADPESIDALVRRICSDGSPLAGLVNCAAIFGESSVDTADWETWRRTLAVNVIGAYQLIVRCVPAFGQAGAIVNITSVEAFHVLSTGGLTSVPYGASKGALQTVTQSLAIDLAPRGIRVNAVAPGFVQTPLNADVIGDDHRRKLIESRIPLGGKIAQAGDIAGPVCFLLSDDARYITGQTIVVDGGLTLGTIRPAFPASLSPP